MILNILTIDKNKDFLVKPTKFIDETKIFDNKEAQDLIDSMIHTMYNAKGVGLAANQVGSEWRICVIKNNPKDIVLVNPIYVCASKHTKKYKEGCLSVPGQHGETRRFEWVTITGFNRYGNPIEFKRVSGKLAHVLQHEIDHCNGHLYTERLINNDK